MPQPSLFSEFDENQPKFKLFLAIQLDLAIADLAYRLGGVLHEQHGLRGKLRPRGLLHITLHHLGDFYGSVPQSKIEAAIQACSSLTAAPFDVVLDQAMRFSNRSGKAAFVLLAGEPLEKLLAFQQALGVELARVGLPQDRSFTPHVTLSYEQQPVTAHPIKPIRWTAKEFVLIQSPQGDSRHDVIQSWPLIG